MALWIGPGLRKQFDCMHEVMLDYDMDIMNLLSQIYRPDISRLQGDSDHCSVCLYDPCYFTLRYNVRGDTLQHVYT